LQKVPFWVRLFKVVAPNDNIDWISINSEDPLIANVVQDKNAKRWQVEQLYRELKQLTGIEKYQMSQTMRSTPSYCLLLSKHSLPSKSKHKLLAKRSTDWSMVYMNF